MCYIHGHNLKRLSIMVYKKVYPIKGMYYNRTQIYFIEDTKNILYRFDFSGSYLMFIFSTACV